MAKTSHNRREALRAKVDEFTLPVDDFVWDLIEKEITEDSPSSSKNEKTSPNE